MNEERIRDLQSVNWLAKHDRSKSDFCYLIKDLLLSEFGTEDGFDLQTFTRDEYDDFGDGWFPTGNIWSWHRHVLKRVRVGDAIFHVPTDEFDYEDRRGRKKRSPGFEEFAAKCSGEVGGIREVPDGFDKTAGVRALRRLVHQFYPLLRSKISKQQRGRFPFIRIKYWWDHVDGLYVRIPNHVAVCSGCGLKLEATLSDLELKLDGEISIFRPNFPEKLRIECDARRVRQYDRDLECSEFLKDFRRSFRPQDPSWVEERRAAAEWIREVIPVWLDTVTAGFVPDKLTL